MNCPRCSTLLSPALYEGISIDRCTRCKGIWLDHGELPKIINRREEVFSEEFSQALVKQAFSGVPDQAHSAVLLCPKCQNKMHPLNYVVDSGIIIDRCDDHGVWFDATELDQAQAHREYWEEQAKKNESKWKGLATQKDFTDEQASSGFFYSMAEFISKLF